MSAGNTTGAQARPARQTGQGRGRLERFRVAKAPELAALAALKERKTPLVPYKGTRPGFARALTREGRTPLAVIAEFKQASPSQGPICTSLTVEDVETTTEDTDGNVGNIVNLPVGSSVMVDTTSVASETQIVMSMGTEKSYPAAGTPYPVPATVEAPTSNVVTFSYEESVETELPNVDDNINTVNTYGKLAEALEDNGSGFTAKAADADKVLGDTETTVTITLTAEEGYFFPADIKFIKSGLKVTEVELESVSTDGKTATIVVTVEAAG